VLALPTATLSDFRPISLAFRRDLRAVRSRSEMSAGGRNRPDRGNPAGACAIRFGSDWIRRRSIRAYAPRTLFGSETMSPQAVSFEAMSLEAVSLEAVSSAEAMSAIEAVSAS
jgi:hypothetical protein